MAKPTKPTPTVSNPVPTNYAHVTINGLYITFLVQPDGTGIVQSPDSLKGRIMFHSSQGWVLV